MDVASKCLEHVLFPSSHMAIFGAYHSILGLCGRVADEGRFACNEV